MRIERGDTQAETPQPEARNTLETISVIIPVWRDHGFLIELLPVLLGAPEVLEVIVSFAEADQAVMDSVKRLGARCVDAGEPNRGGQMDAGARMASGNWLLFHHGDTKIEKTHLAALGGIDPSSGIVGGAFYRLFDERHPRLRWLEPVERWHNRTCGALYGDQSIFVRRETFAILGGYRGLPLMEDVDFSLRLRAHGKVRLLDPPIASSPRKHLARGAWRTTLLNAILQFSFRCGVSPRRLHRWYYKNGASKEGEASASKS